MVVNFIMRLTICCCLILSGFAITADQVSAQTAEAELTRNQRQALKKLDDEIEKAERLLAGGRAEPSAKSLAIAARFWQEALTDLTPEYRAALGSSQTRLQALRTKLEAEKQTVPEIMEMPPPAGTVMFREQVVPILVAKCGNCHVSRARGQFSMATFEELSASPHLVAGQPAASRMILAIETGEMPQGNLTVSPEELAILKKWIEQGAKSNLANNRQNLSELVEQPMNNQPAMLEVKLPSGNETVSFSAQVAPILVEKCTGCHLEARQARGGLNMTNFAGLLRGGDNGPMLKPGDSENSMLVKKLLGTGGGNRMPQGRDPLADESIALIRKWIDEGAAFDGGDSQIAVRVIAAKERANRSNHGELSANRLDLAKRNWAKVLPQVEPVVVSSDELQIIGNLDESDLQKISKDSIALIKELKTAFKHGADQPLVKGKITVFLFRQRFDFNEFGVMVLGHPIPREVTSLWQFDLVDARVAMQLSGLNNWEQDRIQFARQLASVYVASSGMGVPRWFAEGVGQATVAKRYAKEDLVKQWETVANQAANQLQAGSAAAANAQERAAAKVQTMQQLLEGRLPEEQTAALGYYFVMQLRADNRSYNRLVAELPTASNFDAAFQQAFGRSLLQYFGLPER